MAVGGLVEAPLGFVSPGNLLARQIDLLKLLHFLVSALLVQNIIVVEVTVALVPMHARFFVVAIRPLELIVVFFDVLQICNLESLVVIVSLKVIGSLRDLGTGRGITGLIIFYSKVRLIELAWADIVIVIQKLVSDSLVFSSL